MDKAVIEVLLEEVLKHFSFNLGSAVDQTEKWMFTVLNFNVVIKLQVVIGKLVSLGFAEDIQVVMVFRRDL